MMFHYAESPEPRPPVRPHETWGYTSHPSQLAAQFELTKHLRSVPEHGLVIDNGSGPGFSVGAAIKVIRPDLIVVGVDYGFAVKQNPRDAEIFIEEVIERSKSQHRSWLKADPSWHTYAVAGRAEELPVKTGAADLVTSYAAIPEYAEDMDASLAESIRILKLGGIGLFGPMYYSTYLFWEDAIRDNPDVTSYEKRVTEIKLQSGYLADVYFTAIKK
jgi:SAM-dependent methyltransferase